MARNETLGVRTTTTTKRLAKIAAEEAGKSLSEWAAEAVRSQALQELDGQHGNHPKRSGRQAVPA